MTGDNGVEVSLSDKTDYSADKLIVALTNIYHGFNKMKSVELLYKHTVVLKETEGTELEDTELDEIDDEIEPTVDLEDAHADAIL